MTTIPYLIEHAAKPEALICLHEAGHAAAALMVGIAPALVELNDDPTLAGPARSRVARGSKVQRRTIACAGFAVEYLLYDAGRLVDGLGAPVDERGFIQVATGQNAFEDKERFFDANYEQPDKTWPKECDRAFMNHAIALSPLFLMPLVTELAEALLIERRLECPRIIEIGAKHLPSMASTWMCPNDGEENDQSNA